MSPFRKLQVLVLAALLVACGDEKSEEATPIDGRYSAVVLYSTIGCGEENLLPDANQSASLRTEDDGSVSFFLGDNQVASLTKANDRKLAFEQSGTQTEDKGFTFSRSSTSSGRWDGTYWLRLYAGGSSCEDEATITLSRKGDL